MFKSQGNYTETTSCIRIKVCIPLHRLYELIYLVTKCKIKVNIMTPLNVHVLNGFTMGELSKPILFDNMKPLKDASFFPFSLVNRKYGKI